MIVTRGALPERNFTIIENCVLRDMRLSFRARGVLAYVLSFPNGVKIASDRLCEAGKEGRDAIRASFKELELAGYVDSNWRPIGWARPKANSKRPPSHVWKAIRSAIFARDNYTCQYCGERGKKLECDHVLPVAKGGGHAEVNLVTACFACNRSKRDKTVAEWRAS